MNLKRFATFCAIVSAFTIFMTTAAQAGKEDTPELLASTVKAGVSDSADLLTLVSEANAFVNRASSDKTYAAKLLEAVKKNDPNAVASVVKEVAPKSTVTIQKINPDFFLTSVFTIKKHTVIVCVDTDNANCFGSHFSLTVS